ncbi:MAG: FixH family protein [Pseudomonadota bacterium]
MSLADTSKTDATTSSSFRFTGYHMAACMIAFFGVIVVVNFSMATMASRSWTGLVVKNSYVASQKFNQDLAASAQQAATGWRSVVAYGDGFLTVEMSNRNGAQPQVRDAVVHIGRPAFEQQDRSVAASVVEGSSQIALPLDLAPGDWFVRFEAKVNGEPYRRDVRLDVSKDGKGVVR